MVDTTDKFKMDFSKFRKLPASCSATVVYTPSEEKATVLFADNMTPEVCFNTLLIGVVIMIKNASKYKEIREEKQLEFAHKKIDELYKNKEKYLK